MAEAGPEHDSWWGVPEWLRQLGLASGLILLIAGAGALAGLLFALTRGITTPLILAIIAAAVFVPWVDGLEKNLRFPRWVGSLVVMLLVLAVALGTVVLVVVGIVNEAEQIGREIAAGFSEIGEWLAEAGLDPAQAEQVRQDIAAAWDASVGGVVGAVVGGLAGAASFLVGGFIALNILFFMMKDAHSISGWLRDRSSGVVATTLLGDSARAIRLYFRGKTVVAASSAVTVYIGALVLDVPLAASIGLVTFFTSYIPYLGAFIAGAFAVLLALGEGGLSSALGILAFVVFANAVIESLVTPVAVGSNLNLHPLVILVVTILGGLVAGFVGITLAAPMTAIGVEVVSRLREAGAFDDPNAPQRARAAVRGP